MEILHAVATEEERRFLSFHEWGILVYEPSTCHALHEIHSTDIIPGTQVRNQCIFLLLFCHLLSRCSSSYPLYIFRNTSVGLKMFHVLGDVP